MPGTPSKQYFFKCMVKRPFCPVKTWNHPIETTIWNWRNNKTWNWNPVENSRWVCFCFFFKFGCGPWGWTVESTGQNHPLSGSETKPRGHHLTPHTDVKRFDDLNIPAESCAKDLNKRFKQKTWPEIQPQQVNNIYYMAFFPQVATAFLWGKNVSFSDLKFWETSSRESSKIRPWTWLQPQVSLMPVLSGSVMSLWRKRWHETWGQYTNYHHISEFWFI